MADQPDKDQSKLSEKIIRNLMAKPLETQGDRRLFAEIAAQAAKRQTEGLMLYRPRPQQVQAHTSPASERVVRGGVRSGKTVFASAEFASAATRSPIIGPDGNPLPFTYPTKRPLILWVIGFDQAHIGQTIYRMLFEEGAFKIIKDEQTGKMRAWRPWEPSDKARELDTMPAPPLIPERLIDKDAWGWEDKAKRVFTTCRLRNGNKIFAYSSKGEPKKGDPVDLIWIDEDIAFPDHVAEWQSRLSDNRGRLIWSVFPLTQNNALMDMSKRAKAQKDRAKPDIVEIVLKFSDNPYIDADEKRKRLEGWSDVERRARDEGQFVLDEMLVYPHFSAFFHGMPNAERTPGLIELALQRNGWLPPKTWTRYVAIDPGHTVAAALFAAVPPPELGDYVVIYDEVYERKSDAFALAKAIHAKSQGVTYRTFLIDARAGRQTPMGYGKTVKAHYADAFKSYGLESETTSNSFTPANDDIQAGLESVRLAMAPRMPDGTPRLRFLCQRLPHMLDEIGTYRKRVSKDETKDEPIQSNNHLMDALRYLLSHKLEYFSPVLSERPPSPAYLAYKQMFGSKDESTEAVMMGPAA